MNYKQTPKTKSIKQHEPVKSNRSNNTRRRRSKRRKLKVDWAYPKKT